MTMLIRTFALALCVSALGCSSGSSDSQEKLDSCEQVKEFEDTYQQCIEEAKKTS
jgi:hypothetical protein